MLSTEQKITALQQAVQTSPEYADIVPLFIGIYEFIRGLQNPPTTPRNPHQLNTLK